MEIAKPYLLFLGDVHDQLAAKTAQGIVDWRRDWCVGQLRLAGCKADTGLDDVGIEADFDLLPVGAGGLFRAGTHGEEGAGGTGSLSSARVF